MKRWTGYPAGAPWFDDWRSGYLDPVQQQLEETCNGIPRGNDRFSGNYMYYYVVFNTDAALEMVDQVAAVASVRFLLDVHKAEGKSRYKFLLTRMCPNIFERCSG